MFMLILNLLRLLELVILIRVVLSWMSPDPRGSSFSWFTGPVDSIMKPFRVLIPIGGGFLDAGPVLALLLLQMIERILMHLLMRGF